MIEVKNITKSFDGKTILHDVSAGFETGKTNLIIGRAVRARQSSSNRSWASYARRKAKSFTTDAT